MFAATPAWSVTSVNLPLPSLRNRWLWGRTSGFCFSGCVFQPPAAGHVEVGFAIVVVIKPDASAARSFEQRAELLRPKAVRKLSPRRGGGILEPDRRGGLGLRQHRRRQQQNVEYAAGH